MAQKGETEYDKSRKSSHTLISAECAIRSHFDPGVVHDYDAMKSHFNLGVKRDYDVRYAFLPENYH